MKNNEYSSSCLSGLIQILCHQQSLKSYQFSRYTSLFRSISWLIGISVILLLIILGMGFGYLLTTHLRFGWVSMFIPAVFFVIAILWVLFKISKKVQSDQEFMQDKEKEFNSSCDKILEKLANIQDTTENK